jgi:ubiquinone biosynthesis protein COQ9
VKEVYQEQMCSNGIKETESSESDNARIAGEKCVDFIFYAKRIIHLECAGKADCRW